MLIEVLGLYMRNPETDGVGWLSALTDKQIGEAITAMHEKPGYRWTLQNLAERVGMSRSAFALRFKEKVGTSAMEYLTRWRMHRAGHRLVNSKIAGVDVNVHLFRKLLGVASLEKSLPDVYFVLSSNFRHQVSCRCSVDAAAHRSSQGHTGGRMRGRGEELHSVVKQRTDHSIQRRLPQRLGCVLRSSGEVPIHCQLNKRRLSPKAA